MNLLLNTPLPLGTFIAEASWRSDDELTLCEEAAAACNVGGTLSLVDDADDQLEFYCTLTSTAAPERIAFRYSLPARTGTVVIDRLHTRSEVLAELAFTAAGGDDEPFKLTQSSPAGRPMPAVSHSRSSPRPTGVGSGRVPLNWSRARPRVLA